MLSRIGIATILLSFLSTSAAQTQAPSPKDVQKVQAASVSAEVTARVPVKRVVLYKNGIGYFEHFARVHGNQELAIDFTTAQLNDVLKSLTAVDTGEGHISSIRYNSVAPLDERLKALRLPFGAQVNQADFLSALRGARVEVRSGSASSIGRLLSVEKERKTNGKGDFYDATIFSIVSDLGEMKNFELGPGTTVRLAEKDLSEEVGRYLSLVGSSRARDLRRMILTASGGGDRDIFVSYISEVPIWKSTYRIILDAKAKPLLQGWAIVDNTVGEDWKDVQLSLVAGAPQSFIQNISQPYYVRRPVLELPTSVMLTPQSHEGTVSEGIGSGSGGGVGAGVGAGAYLGGVTALRGTVRDPSGASIPGAHVTVRNEETGASQSTVTDARGVYQFFAVQAGNSALFVSSPGFRRFDLTNFYLGVGRNNEIDARLELGSTAESVTVAGDLAQVNTSEASISALAEKQHVEAEGKDMGDYFEYVVKQKISIGKNQSAMVPILQSHVDAEKVSIWNEGSKEIRRALWMTNSSDLTLDSGTFNIIDGDAFAGEGQLETIHPKERRLISYAADPALRITMDLDPSEHPVSHVRIAKGMMILTQEQREIRKYVLHNSDEAPRQVIIEHPSREGWKLADGAKPEETTASFLRFRVGVGPGKTENLELNEFHPEDSEYELSNLDEEEVVLLTNQKRITPAMQQAFKRILDQKYAVGNLQAQVKAQQTELDAITKDQSRLRENMKALKGSAEEKALLQRYTRQLDSQEDRLEKLHLTISDLQEKQSKAEEDLEKLVQEVTLDESF